MSVISTLLSEIFHHDKTQPKHIVRGKIIAKKWWLDETNQFLLAIGEYLMATKGKNKKKATNDYGITFVNIQVPVDRREEAKVWCSDCVEHLGQIMPEFLSDGYKFSVRWDDDNETNIVSMTQVADGHPNIGKCLVSRSSDWCEAIALCLFKTKVLCPNEVWPNDLRDNEWG